jgi:hypothetical protein
MLHEVMNVRLDAPAGLLPALASFYEGSLGLPLTRSGGDGLTIEIGKAVVDFRPAQGSPYYHVALLVPGDRFAAALAWAEERVVLLADGETGETVFDFTNWDARAIYFHDPAGTIVELIAHRGVGEAGATGAFAPAELLGISEIGVVGDPRSLAEVLERELGLEIWDGTVEGEGRLAFVGEKARTLILCRAGRPWLPTGRPAEAHPVEVVVTGRSAGTVALDAGGSVSVTAS